MASPLKQCIALLLALTLALLPLRGFAAMPADAGAGSDAGSHCNMMQTSSQTNHARHMPMPHDHDGTRTGAHHEATADGATASSGDSTHTACNCCDGCDRSCGHCLHFSAIMLTAATPAAQYSSQVLPSATEHYLSIRVIPLLHPPSY